MSPASHKNSETWLPRRIQSYHSFPGTNVVTTHLTSSMTNTRNSDAAVAAHMPSATLPPSAYARLCEGSIEGRLRYLFSVFDARENGSLDRSQLSAAVALLEEYAKSADAAGSGFVCSSPVAIPTEDFDGLEDAAEQIVDSLLVDGQSISCDEFVNVLRDNPTVVPWFDHLSEAPRDFIEESIRTATEQQLQELSVQRANCCGARSPGASSNLSQERRRSSFSSGNRNTFAFKSAFPDKPLEEKLGQSFGSVSSTLGRSSEGNLHRPINDIRSSSIDSSRSISSPVCNNSAIEPSRHRRVRLVQSTNPLAGGDADGKGEVDAGREADSKLEADVRRVVESKAEFAAKRTFVIEYNKLKFKRVIGTGACATVWSAEWLHMPVAVKVMNDEDNSPQASEMVDASIRSSRKLIGDYLSEIDCLTQIRHPNVCLYMGMCIYPKVCIVSELYLGGSVHDYLHGPNPRVFEPMLALDMISNVARGMLYLHTPGLTKPVILHRDLKASNILVDRGVTHCVICDFGLSRIQDRSASGAMSTRANTMIGTPYTMAPEVMEGQPYMSSSDVYSFGIVAWEMWTGRIPYEGLRPIQLMFKTTEGERPPIDRDIFPTLLAELLSKCWAHEPAARPDFDLILGRLEDPMLAEEVQVFQEAWNSKKGSTVVSSGDLDNKGLQSKSLMDVIYDGNVEAAMRLISGGADVQFSDYDNRTPLHIACAEGHYDCAKLLIENGADVQSRDRWNQTPLHESRRCRHGRISELLLTVGGEDTAAENSSDGLMRSERGEMAATGTGVDAVIARNSCNPKTEMIHPSRGSNSVPMPDSSGTDRTSKLRACLDMMCAVYDCDSDRVCALLRAGYNANAADYDCRTPLHLAASEGFCDIAMMLIEHGADVQARDRWGSTPLDEANRGGHKDLGRILENADQQESSGDGEYMLLNGK